MLVHQCRLTFSHSPTKKSPYAVKCWTTSIYKIPTTKICVWGSFCGILPKGLLRYISDVGMRCRHAMQVWNVGTISKRVTVNIKFNQAKWWSSFICIPTYLPNVHHKFVNSSLFHCIGQDIFFFDDFLPRKNEFCLNSPLLRADEIICLH